MQSFLQQTASADSLGEKLLIPPGSEGVASIQGILCIPGRSDGFLNRGRKIEVHKVRKNSDGLSEVGLSHSSCEVCESRRSEEDSK